MATLGLAVPVTCRRSKRQLRTRISDTSVTLAIPDHWPRVREIFEAALALPPDIRRSYVAKACDGDELVSQEVELLLGSHERATGTSRRASTWNSYVKTPTASSLGDAAATRNLEGNRIGP